MTAGFAVKDWKTSNAGVDQPDSAGAGDDGVWTLRLVAAAIAFCLLLQLHLVFVQPINWDEFRFLADIHTYARGELSGSLLTFQVHFFGWLTGLGNEIEQVRAGRLVMLALEAGTLAFIWMISRRFFEPAAALLAVLGYVSFSFVLQHGASFRFDPIVIFLVMGAIVLLLRDRLSWLAIAGVGLALAVATMISIKTALIVPLIVAVAVSRLADRERRRETFVRLLGAAVMSAVFLGLLYAWHVSTLAGTTSVEAQQGLSASYSKTLGDMPFFPRRQYFLRSVTENPLHWLLLLLGIAGVAGGFRKNRARALTLLAFLLPLLSVAVYRNAFPYFYAVILAPAAIFFAAAASRLDLRRILGPVALVLAAGGVLHHQQALSDSAKDQERTIEAVHAMFPQPVAYIDRCSMIASFPQAGMFLSTWWMENYVVAGKPVVRDVLLRKQPVFVIADSPFLLAALNGQPAAEMRGGFLEEDRQALQSNYVHHWGPVWVAGKVVEATPAGTEAEFLIGGHYSVESGQSVQVDGRWVAPGQSLRIGPGKHRVAAAGTERVRFRWAHVPRPNASVPAELEFGRF